MDNNISISLDYLDSIVKSNEGALEEVDKILEKNPKIKEQYKNDVKALESAKMTIDDILSVLFENMTASIQDDKGASYLPTHLTYGTPAQYLRMAGRTEIPEMIKNLRRLQLIEFGQPASYKRMGRDIGFHLTWKNPLYNPTDEEKKSLVFWEQKFAERFFFPPGEYKPNLGKFLGTCYNDFFDLDDITIQILRDSLGQPIGLLLQDPTLWYPTIPRIKQYPRVDAEYFDLPEEGDDFEIMSELKGTKIEHPHYDYLLMRAGKRYAAATSDILIKSHFFLRSEYRTYRRGNSIMEKAINVTSIILNAITFNASNFSNNRMPAGLLALSGGGTNQLLIEKTKKLIWAQMSGVANQHKIPIVGLPEKSEAKWVAFHESPKELEFYTGLTLFTSIIFALSGTDPNESGLANFNDAMKGNRLNEESKDGIWKKSRDNGLITFIAHIESTLNTPMNDGKNVFEQACNMPVKVEFRGLAGEDLKNKLSSNEQRLQQDTSINDLRTENGLERVELKVGDYNIYDIKAISNPVIAKIILQLAQPKQNFNPKSKPEKDFSPNNLTDIDRQLIEQFGQPVKSNKSINIK